MPQIRAVPVPYSKPAWKGEYRLRPNGLWHIARNGYGAILYESAEAAIAGAQVCRVSDAGWNAVRRALNSPVAP